MKTEKIEVIMTQEQFSLLQRTKNFYGRRVVGWWMRAERYDSMIDTLARRVELELEVAQPVEAITISPTAANEIHLELIKLRNQFEETAKKIASLLDKS